MKSLILLHRDLPTRQKMKHISDLTAVYFQTLIKFNSKSNMCKEFEMLPCIDMSTGELQHYIMPELNELSEKAYNEGKTVFFVKKTIDNIFSTSVESVSTSQIQYFYTTNIEFNSETYNYLTYSDMDAEIIDIDSTKQLSDIVYYCISMGLLPNKDMFVKYDNMNITNDVECVDALNLIPIAISFKPLQDTIFNKIMNYINKT